MGLILPTIIIRMMYTHKQKLFLKHLLLFCLNEYNVASEWYVLVTTRSGTKCSYSTQI